MTRIRGQPSKLAMRVRFPSPAPLLSSSPVNFERLFDWLLSSAACWLLVASIGVFSQVNDYLRPELCWYSGLGGGPSSYPTAITLQSFSLAWLERGGNMYSLSGASAASECAASGA